MSSIVSNLYPPIMQDTAPAFIRTKSCRLYFSLSSYTNAADIANVQISVVDQKTNATALKEILYPSGIKIMNLYYDPKAVGDNKYYVILNYYDMKNNQFEINKFYKVQLRFTSIDAENPPSRGTQVATWIYNNLDYFSEWSSVCLIKGIDQPNITIRKLDAEDSNQTTVLNTSSMEIVGKMYFNDTKETEYLKSYRIQIYEQSDPSTVVYDSGDILSSIYSLNEFNHEIKYNLNENTPYGMDFIYTTNNLYTSKKTYKFIVVPNAAGQFEATITATPDSLNGRIKIDVQSENSFTGNLVIRRTSSETEFTQWEDIKISFYQTEEALNASWYDMTVKSGVWYQYGVQKQNSHGDRSNIIQIDEPVICEFDSMFLTTENCQLGIKFNPSVQQFKYNVVESHQMGLGSKYPYITRNGDNYYRTFSIGGLICSFVDTTNWFDPHYYENETEGTGEFRPQENEIGLFATKETIYGSAASLYEAYNSENNISSYNDYIYEREFRQKVYDFLYDNSVKLFRSTTEGNILIKLMDISFQPEVQLGRRYYSFSATAVEIAEDNIENYDKYGIQTVGDYQNYSSYTLTKIGQLQGTYNYYSGNLLTQLVLPKYGSEIPTGYMGQNTTLSWLKIEIESAPYVIIEQDGELIKATGDSTEEKELLSQNPLLGYIAIINNQEVIIRANSSSVINSSNNPDVAPLGVLELKGTNVAITDLQFKYPVTATIDFIANIDVIEDYSSVATQTYYYQKVGQLYGSFSPNASNIRQIYDKYYYEKDSAKQYLLNVNKVQVEVPQNTVIYTKTSDDTELHRQVLTNGYLQLQDDDVNIVGLYLYGIHLEECAAADNRPARETEYIATGEHYSDISAIVNPVPNGVYEINTYTVEQVETYDSQNDTVTVHSSQVIEQADNEYSLLLHNHLSVETTNVIYYHEKWYPFTSDNDVICPINGIIDYKCEVVKEVY